MTATGPLCFHEFEMKHHVSASVCVCLACLLVYKRICRTNSVFTINKLKHEKPAHSTAHLTNYTLFNEVIIYLILNLSYTFLADLTEIQVVVADVNTKYEQLGGDLQERQSRQQASLELCQKARQDSEALHQWLGPREQSLAQGQAASPSRPEVVRAHAQENKVSTEGKFNR